MRLSLLSIPLLLSACVAELEVPIDEDGDGLISTEEEAAGTDPTNPDSDGDGHDDGRELAKGTDPLDIDNFPYRGEYPIERCSTTPEATGDGVGDITADFDLVDQFGDYVNLYDFCGKTVWLVMGAFWWGSCVAEAGGLEEIYQAHKDQGLVIIGLYSETTEYSTPTSEELLSWATNYGMTFPVLADDGSSIYWRYGSGALPTTALLKPGMEVVKIDPTENDILEALGE